MSLSCLACASTVTFGCFQVPRAVPLARISPPKPSLQTYVSEKPLSDDFSADEATSPKWTPPLVVRC